MNPFSWLVVVTKVNDWKTEATWKKAITLIGSESKKHTHYKTETRLA